MKSPPTDTPDLKAIARQLLQAQDRGEQIPTFADRIAGFDNRAAYEVARLIHEARVADGARPLGRKIGFTNAALWPVFNVFEPIWGYVYDNTVVRLPGSHGVCHIGQFTAPRLEPEIILHFHSTPAAGSSPEELLACVDWIAHGFEIVESPFPDWKFSAPDCIAGSACHAMLLVGEPHDVRKVGPDPVTRLAEFAIAVSCGTVVRDYGRGANVLGSPLSAMARLIDVLTNQPATRPVAAGDLVTTGCLTAALPIRAGEVWSTEFTGLAIPGISVRFEE